MKRKLIASVIAAIAVAQSASAFTFTATIRSNVTCVIEAVVLENENAPVDGEAILTTAGLAHGGSAFRPLSGVIASRTNNVRHIILLSMPGREGSELPVGALMGELKLEDYAVIGRQALAACPAHGLHPRTIIAHSMGGLIDFVAQEQLLTDLSSLASAYGVTNVTAIGSSCPRGVVDPTIEDGNATNLVMQYRKVDSSQGEHVKLTPLQFRGLFFLNYFVDVVPVFVPGTPGNGEVVSLGYKSDESLAAALQAVGPSIMRPVVRRKAFDPDNGTSLRLIVGTEDIFSPIQTQNDLYEYLTGDASGAGVIVLSGDAVHDQLISNPSAIADALGL